MELESIIADAKMKDYDFPYSREKNRYLRIEDYQSELLLRKDDTKIKNNRDLEEFFNLFYSQKPEISEFFRKAVKTCRNTEKPVIVEYDTSLSGRQEVLSLLAKGYFRSALHRYAKCTALVTTTEQVWLLPAGMSAYDWVVAGDGFVKATQLKREFPLIFNLCERLAEMVYKSSSRFAMETILDPSILYQAVKVFAVYSRYYSLEELFRVEFAFGIGNRVASRGLVVNPPEFISFTSPTNSLLVSAF